MQTFCYSRFRDADLCSVLSVQLCTKLQVLKREMKEIIDEHITTRQELEQTQNELTRELKYK